jgi:uncharacterized protein (TIGR03067 family)
MTRDVHTTFSVLQWLRSRAVCNHFLAALALAALLLGLGAPRTLPADDKAEKEEQKKFQGHWRPESIKTGNTSLSAEELKKLRLVIEGDKWTVETATGKTEWTWKADPSKSPKTLDFHREYEGIETDMRCLYELKDDTLTVCAPVKNLSQRPKQIAGGEDVSIAVWKREKK